MFSFKKGLLFSLFIIIVLVIVYVARFFYVQHSALSVLSSYAWSVFFTWWLSEYVEYPLHQYGSISWYSVIGSNDGQWEKFVLNWSWYVDRNTNYIDSTISGKYVLFNMRDWKWSDEQKYYFKGNILSLSGRNYVYTDSLSISLPDVSIQIQNYIKDHIAKNILNRRFLLESEYDAELNTRDFTEEQQNSFKNIIKNTFEQYTWYFAYSTQPDFFSKEVLAFGSDRDIHFSIQELPVWKILNQIFTSTWVISIFSWSLKENYTGFSTLWSGLYHTTLSWLLFDMSGSVSLHDEYFIVDIPLFSVYTWLSYLKWWYDPIYLSKSTIYFSWNDNTVFWKWRFEQQTSWFLLSGTRYFVQPVWCFQFWWSWQEFYATLDVNKQIHDTMVFTEDEIEWEYNQLNISISGAVDIYASWMNIFMNLNSYVFHYDDLTSLYGIPFSWEFVFSGATVFLWKDYILDKKKLPKKYDSWNRKDTNRWLR